MELERLDDLSSKWASSAHFHEIKLRLLFLLDASCLSFPYSPEKTWLRHANKSFWKFIFLTKRKLKDKFYSASVFPYLTVIRIYRAFFFPRKITRVITFVTRWSPTPQKKKKEWQLCVILLENLSSYRSIVTIHPWSRPFLRYRKEVFVSFWQWWSWTNELLPHLFYHL